MRRRLRAGRRRATLRRVRLGLSFCLCGAAFAAPAQAATSLTEAGRASFPERAWVLTLPAGATAPASAVDVLENGRPVSALRVAPANGGEGGGFGVVLAIDTSKSMAGRPIRDAMAAAREFARQRPAGQPLGVVTFNSTPTVLLEPTTDPDAIDSALAGTPPLAPGTHLYDASSAALQQIGGGGLDAGAVVVLSDGADLGSTATPAAVAQAARRAHARVFTVGAGSSAASAQVLQGLATETSGEFLGSAEGKTLARVYRRLGGQLASAYLVRYRSLVPAGRRVRVTATAAGDTATATYRAPRLSVTAASGPRPEPFLATGPGMALVALAALLASFLLIWQLLALRGRRDSVRERVGSYGVAEGTSPAEQDLETGARPARRSARRDTLAERLDIARMGISPEAYVGLWTLAGIVLTVFTTTVSGTVLFAPLAVAGTWLAARALLASRVEKQRSAFADQLADGLQTVASAMRTGHSFAGGLAALVEESGEPLSSEFARVLADERVGVPLEDALQKTIDRMDNRDLEQVALVAILQRETGGNGAEALDRVVENLRGREEVRRLVRTLTAQGRMSRLVLTLLPIGLLGALSVLGGNYAQPLFNTTIGNVLLALGVVLVALGSFVIKRLIEIKV